MDTETVRLNITLPKGLVQAMNRVTEPRKRSRFIADAVRLKIELKESTVTNYHDKSMIVCISNRTLYIKDLGGRAD
jgi:metal-responsive CopG/Arc/MetJ family transcriptional regulator